MRQALGASRGRLVRQMLVESLLLAFGGAAAGLGIALRRHARARQPGACHDPASRPDLRGRAGARVHGRDRHRGRAPVRPGAGGARLVGAGRRTRSGTAGRGSPAAAGRRVRHTLVAAQLALAVVLLVGAGLLVRSFMRVAGLDLGFRAPQVLTAMINLSPARYARRRTADRVHRRGAPPRARTPRGPGRRRQPDDSLDRHQRPGWLHGGGPARIRRPGPRVPTPIARMCRPVTSPRWEFAS